MTIEEARDIILHHAGMTEVVDQRREVFVSMLRPFSGLREEPFADLIDALVNYYPSLSDNSRVDKKVVFSLWWICNSIRSFILDPECPVRRDKRIDELSFKRAKWWADSIETMSLRSLQGLDRPMCLSRLMQYLIVCPPENLRRYEFLQPLLSESINYYDEDVAEEARQVSNEIGHVLYKIVGRDQSHQ